MKHPTDCAPSFDALPDEAWVRASQLVPYKILPCSTGTLWRWCREGKFPKGTKFSPTMTAWRVGVVRKKAAEFEAAGKTKETEPAAA